MRTKHFIPMLALAGSLMGWQLRDLLRESPWYGAPMVGFIIFAAILNHYFQRPGAVTRRHALLFGVGSVALLATGVAATFGYSFIKLLRGGAGSFDVAWICSAIAAGALSAWLWFRFVRLLR